MSLPERLRQALTTWPDARGWRRTALEALWLAPVLALLAWIGGFAGGSAPTVAELVRLALIAFLVPSFLEEIVFRVALLPSPRAGRSLPRMAAALALFVAWHPLQVLWFGMGWAAVVLNPWFLLAVAALGLALTRIYLAVGSIWPCVLLHWCVVVAWRLLGGAPPWTS